MTLKTSLCGPEGQGRTSCAGVGTEGFGILRKIQDPGSRTAEKSLARESLNLTENSEAARLWARLTGGLGRSQEGDWVDLDEESLGSEDSEDLDPKIQELSLIHI